MLRKFNIFLRTTSLLFLFLLLSSTTGLLAKDVAVEYQTHISEIGWQDSVSDGEISGTTGVGLQLEGMRIYLGNLGSNDLGISYRAHVQDVGWQDWVSNNSISGTTGEGKRLEAIEINLDGQNSSHYNVYYRVHVQDFGWLDWAKNGEDAGTSGLSKRLEALEIQIVGPNESAPVSDSGYDLAYFTPGTIGQVHYRSHVSNLGWLDYSYDGQESGTIGINCPTEAIEIGLSDSLLASGTGNGIRSKAHISDIGWTPDWIDSHEIVGTVGQAKALQAIRLELTGSIKDQYDLYYRSHISTYGWLGWTKNGNASGSEGLGLNIEAVQACLIPKGESFTKGSTSNSFITKYGSKWRFPLDGYETIGSFYGPRDGGYHYGIDFPAPEGTPIHAVTSGKVYFAGGEDNGMSYGYHVKIESDSEEHEHVIYAHMSKMIATEGQTVNQGDIIGYVGQTGNATGPHLHLEVGTRPDYDAVDPLLYFDYTY